MICRTADIIFMVGLCIAGIIGLSFVSFWALQAYEDFGIVGAIVVIAIASYLAIMFWAAKVIEDCEAAQRNNKTGGCDET